MTRGRRTVVGMLVGITLVYAPGQAASPFSMTGIDEIRFVKPLPVCPPQQVSPCPGVSTTFTTTPLTPTIAYGTLQGKSVDAQYQCPQSGTIAGTATTYKAYVKYTCVRISGTGPKIITGRVNNAANPGLPLYTGVMDSCATIGGPPGAACPGHPQPVAATSLRPFVPTRLTSVPSPIAAQDPAPTAIITGLVFRECTSNG